jgi:hypothetical protein
MRTKTIRHIQFWMYILLTLFVPGASATMIALNITKSTLPFRKILGRRLRRYFRIIYTSKKNILIVCGLENILHWLVLGSISFIIFLISPFSGF